ncbi:carbohydrate porin [Rhizosaccharibacter radicis]|uniref:Carbohydrate porin n=1 Tax=Rhizosaccharibacter radicis TaxID=2782605 RepID=A0ABT1VYD0_9PROT|nr:carbohydrate porin [Acetobacteraceae bacterium KSS12]
MIRFPDPKRDVLLLLSACMLATGEARAQEGQPGVQTQQQPAIPAQPQGSTGITPDVTPSSEANGSLMERSNLLGDPGGVRAALARAGIGIALQETSEVLGNSSGGSHRGAIYEGLTAATLTIDTSKLFGLAGGTVNISAYQVHGRGLTANNIGNLDAVSSLEADRSLRLFELWYEQSLFDGHASLRIGKQAADQEFMISLYGSLFISSQFGWPPLPSLDLPGGANAYPLATPGVRLALHPTDDLTILTALYNGAPAGRSNADPQALDGGGTRFDVDDGAFVITEVQYAINHGDNAHGLPGIYRVGGYYNSNAVPDQRFDNAGRSLADPASNGTPLLHRRDWGIYAIFDQLLLHGSTPSGGLGAFGRFMGTRGDRNLASVYVEGGLTWRGIAASRPDDTLGVAAGFTRIGGQARALDRDAQRFSDALHPLRDGETDIELTYQAQITPWLAVQPDFQYVIHPGGRIADSVHPTHILGDAAVEGLRIAVTF